MLKLLLVFIVILISSCEFSRQENKISRDNFHGYYKIGEPYEIDGKWYHPREDPDYVETGIASWYGPAFHGKLTANGDTFDQNALTAAHRTLPIPSMVRVTNLANDKTIILMVNDRGPFSKGRIIDVSKRAAEILGFQDKGITKVRVQFLKGQTARLLSDLPGNKVAKKVHKDFPMEEEQKEAENLNPMQKFTKKIKTSNPITLLPTGFAPIAKPTAKTITPEIDKADINIDLSQPEVPANTPTPATPELAEMPAQEEIAQTEEITNQAEETINQTPDSGEDIIGEEATDLATAEEAAKALDKIYIQAGTFGLQENAERAESNLRAVGNVMISPVNIGERMLYRVKLGPIEDRQMAEIALDKVIRMGHTDALIIGD